ncbi:hypothetical protein MRB53_030244 [Persea americana]|uniref:Uncharacterized protein n=1 Tax=Persea americana TaxID=3435 RepID=A0ACC2KL31_PERAE|nr:hypothetical protein MRB53_030244 [Persea americana]
MGQDVGDDQVALMKEAFNLFNMDDDGRIAPSELGILMRSLGGNPTQAHLKEIKKNIDKGGAGWAARVTGQGEVMGHSPPVDPDPV